MFEKLNRDKNSIKKSQLLLRKSSNSMRASFTDSISSSILKQKTSGENNLAVVSKMDERSQIKDPKSSGVDFNTCYNALRKSYSVDHIIEEFPKQKPYFSTLRRFKQLFKSADRRGSIKSKSSYTSEKQLKKQTSNKILAEADSSDISSSTQSSSDVIDEFKDIDDSTALNTLYNLFNELVDLNRQNRKKAEDLVLRFNLLRECFNDLEYKISTERHPYKKSNLDHSDETTLKENTDVVSLMFLDENGNDMSSNLGDIVKLLHETENNVNDQVLRYKAIATALPESPRIPSTSSKPQAIFGYLKSQTKSEYQFIPSLHSHLSQTDVESTSTPSSSQFKSPNNVLGKTNVSSNQEFSLSAGTPRPPGAHTTDMYLSDNFSHLKDSIADFSESRKSLTSGQELH